MVTAKAHDGEEILKPDYRPGSDGDSQELFQLKNDFMYSVFNRYLLKNMGKAIVRKYLTTIDVQAVWEEFESHN